MIQGAILLRIFSKTVSGVQFSKLSASISKASVSLRSPSHISAVSSIAKAIYIDSLIILKTKHFINTNSHSLPKKILKFRKYFKKTLDK